MFQGFISKFTKNSLVKAAATACIVVSMAFGAPTKIGSSNTYWEIVDGVLTISGTGAMPTTFTNSGGTNPWWSSRTNITTVIIQDGVTSIGNNSFYNHTGLTSVTIPNSVTSIGNYAFSGCTGLTSITIPNSVTSIGDGAFNGCKGLTSITIPNSVNTIASGAFRDCSGLTSITIPNSVTSIGTSAFNGCTGLTSVTIPNSVTSIELAAFYDCSGLTSVTIPNSVTAVGTSAFGGCTGLTEINIGNGLASTDNLFLSGDKLKSINVADGNNNFSSIGGVLFNKQGTSLNRYPSGKPETTYEIPSSVTSIGNSAFNGCTGLTSITIPNSVTSIGNNAFQKCTGLTSMTIPASVTSIGNYAFDACTGLTEIKVDAGNTNYVVEGGILYDAAKTKIMLVPYKLSGAVTIPNTVTGSLISNFFAGRAGLTSINIGDGITSIELAAFQNCTGLTEITIGSGLTSISNDGIYPPFGGCTGLTKVTVDENNTTFASQDGILYNKAKTTTRLIPDKLSGAVTIPNSMASVPYLGGRAGLTSVTLPDAITSLGSNIFRNCTGLTEITIPNTVTTIGDSTFAGCTGLTAITIPNSVTAVGNNAFGRCTELTEINIGNGLASTANLFLSGDKLKSINVAGGNNNFSSIGGVLFNKTGTSLNRYPRGKPETTYEIPVSVTSIGNNAFQNCTGLTSITIPNSVTTIGNYAFSGCTGLTSMTIPNSVTTIGNYAFQNCTGLTSMTIPNSVTSIGNQAFRGCTGLTSMTIPASVTTIGTNVFALCTGLTEITADENNTYFASQDGILYNNQKTTFVAVPLGLTRAIIPNSITSIPASTFSGCTGLTSMTIPNSVTTIGDSTFAGCTGLTHIINLRTTPQGISGNVFGNVTYADLNLFVPTSALTAYKAVGVWEDFKNVLSIETPKPTAIANLVYTGSEQTGITEDVRYVVTGGKAQNVGEHEAKIVLLNGLKWENAETTGEITLKWSIAKAPGAAVAPVLASKTHNSITITAVSAASGQVVEYAINTTNTAPTNVTAWETGLTFTELSANTDYYIFARTIENDNYHAGAISAGLSVKTDVVSTTTPPIDNTPIREIQKSDGRTGIRLSKNVVSDKAEFEVILPSDKVLEVKAVIYDNTGNVVFEKIERGANVSWNLTNISGRNVANGTYLIIVEAKGVNGNYAYSAKVGVKK